MKYSKTHIILFISSIAFAFLAGMTVCALLLPGDGNDGLFTGLSGEPEQVAESAGLPGEPSASPTPVPTPEPTPSSTPKPSPTPTPTPPPPTPSPSPSPAVMPRDLDELEGVLLGALGDVPDNTRFGVLIECLDNGSKISFCLNDYVNYGFVADKTVLPFFMGAVYERVSSGSISLTAESENSLHAALADGDLEAGDRFTLLLGGSYSSAKAAINSYARNNGFADTLIYRLLNEYNAGLENFTSPEDLALIFSQIYNGTLISEEYSAKMLSLMLEPQGAGTILRSCADALSIDADLAVVTGDLPGLTQAECALVLTENAGYIVCVMANPSETIVSTVKNPIDNSVSEKLIQRVMELTLAYITA